MSVKRFPHLGPTLRNAFSRRVALFHFKQKMIGISAFYSSGQEDLTWLVDLLKTWMSPDNYLSNFPAYPICLLWMLTPVVLLFSPVLLILGCIYLSNLLLHIHKRQFHLKENYLSKSWDNGRRTVSYLWDTYGKLCHGKHNYLLI